MNYDRLCNTAPRRAERGAEARRTEAGDIIMFYNNLDTSMREPRFELGCLAAPDPKSHRTPETSGLPSEGTPPAATERHRNVARVRPIVRHAPVSPSQAVEMGEV